MRRRRYYEPENLGREQSLRDAAYPNRRFYVYVLKTDRGHYVGHTAHVGARLRQHQGDQVESTAGSNPSLVWTSGPRATRRDAATFEAAMKSLRDQHSPRFAEITGVTPTPWRHRRCGAGWLVPAWGRDTRRAGRSRRRRRPWLAPALRREMRRTGRSRRRRRLWLVLAVVTVLVGRLVVDAIGTGLF